MWISTEKLERLDKILENHLDNYIKIFIIHYLVYNNYYHLINNKTLKETYHLLESININELIELNWFFNKETNIKNGWEELSPEFYSKFPSIYKFINEVKYKISKFPVMDESNYLKNSSLI